MSEIVYRKPPRLALTVIAALHLTVVLWHGSTHSQLAIALSRFQTLFVFGVIVTRSLFMDRRREVDAEAAFGGI